MLLRPGFPCGQLFKGCVCPTGVKYSGALPVHSIHAYIIYIFRGKLEKFLQPRDKEHLVKNLIRKVRNNLPSTKMKVVLLWDLS